MAILAAISGLMSRDANHASIPLRAQNNNHTGTNQPGTFGNFRGSRRARMNLDRIAYAMGTRKRVRV